MTYQGEQTPEQWDGVGRRKGWPVKWNPEVGLGAVLQIVTVICAAAAAISAYTANQTKMDLSLTAQSNKIDENQKIVLQRFSDIQTDFAKQIADVKTDTANKIADVKGEVSRANTELSGNQKETATIVSQMQRTLDQTLPRFEDRFTNIMGMLQGAQARLEELMKWKSEADGRLTNLEQFKTRVESASPATKRGG